LACQKRAEYGYEYEVKETKEIEVWGKTSQLKKGTYSKGLTFIKNLSDKWQIRQL
jgi:hypothetical protein